MKEIIIENKKTIQSNKNQFLRTRKKYERINNRK